VVDALFHKPDWSPFLLFNCMYTGHFSVYRRDIVESVGGFRSEFDFSQDYDLALRVAERASRIAHIEECLYGWRMIPGSGSVGGKPTARLSNVAALQSAADRRGYGGEAIALPTANRLKRPPPEPRPLVSIVVPSDNVNRIEAALDSIASRTSYREYEVLVVARSSVIAECEREDISDDVRFVAYDKPFNFSDKCNVGAAAANGGYVIFFNDDVLVVSADWIESILEIASLPGVGIVGPKLLYENGTIQHAGMVTGVRRLVGTAFHTFPSESTAYFNFSQSVREVSLISGACLAMPMHVFEEVGGFDADNVPISHSDVDLCFKVRELGYSCVYTPHAELFHIGHSELGAAETRAVQAEKPFERDKADIFLLKQWSKYCKRDPYFPPRMRDLVYIDSQERFQYFAPAHRSENAGPDVLIFSHDLSGSGAPKIVFDLAQVLIEQGCFVVVMSPEDGTFRDRLLAIGAHVIVDPLALTGHPVVTDLVKNFDVVIANTVVCWRAFKPLAPFIPMYWYVHEAELFDWLADKYSDFLEAFGYATAVWAGSVMCGEVLQRFGIEHMIVEYGVEDPTEDPGFRARQADPDRITISLFATYEPRKGQELAVQGFQDMRVDVRKRCRLRLAGRTNDRHFREAVEAIAARQTSCDIELQEALEFSSYRQQLSDTDIVLFTSRSDTLPLVSLNALAEGKILICSQETGTSKYIRDGVSGFVLERNHPEVIASTLERVVARVNEWDEIGRAARKVFLGNFSTDHFRKRLLAALSGVLSPAEVIDDVARDVRGSRADRRISGGQIGYPNTRLITRVAIQYSPTMTAAPINETSRRCFGHETSRGSNGRTKVAR
jgi:O-antigen biosynthesis protein